MLVHPDDLLTPDINRDLPGHRPSTLQPIRLPLELPPHHGLRVRHNLAV